jgi:hypothetical protein
MGSTDCFVGSSQASPERLVPIAQQCYCSTERSRQGMFPSAAAEVAVVEIPSLQYFQLVDGREMCPRLRLNYCWH